MLEVDKFMRLLDTKKILLFSTAVTLILGGSLAEYFNEYSNLSTQFITIAYFSIAGFSIFVGLGTIIVYIIISYKLNKQKWDHYFSNHPMPDLNRLSIKELRSLAQYLKQKQLISERKKHDNDSIIEQRENYIKIIKDTLEK